ncbi:MAG: hypothetical protein AB1349_06450 [Elusimicrobiota bacterium]
MRVHRVDNRNHSARYFKWAFIVVLLGSFYVWQKNAEKKLAYKTSEINDRILTLTDENKLLTMKIMNITAMNNLEEIAKKRGLVKPKPSDIIVIKE